jgi:hypothetical protein
MRVERGHADARRVEAGRAHRPVGQHQPLDDRVARDALGDARERHMRGDARVPQAGQHVELARLGGQPEHLLREHDLVLVARMREPHGRLVEGREHDGLGDAGDRRGHRRLEVLERVAATGVLDRSHADGRGIQMAEVDQHRAG